MEYVQRAIRIAFGGLGMAAVSAAALLVWAHTGAVAIHFCGWPAKITCDDGSRIWWLVPAGMATLALVCSVALAAWAWTGKNGLVPWLLAGWMIFFPFPALSRTFGTGALIFYGLYGYLCLGLLAVLGIGWFPERRSTIYRVLGAIAVIYVVILVLLPGYLQQVQS